MIYGYMQLTRLDNRIMRLIVITDSQTDKCRFGRVKTSENWLRFNKGKLNIMTIRGFLF